MAKDRITGREKIGTNGYVAKINKLVRAEYGEIPDKLTILIQKTARDMRMMEAIDNEIQEHPFTTLEMGSQGQSKTVVNPLVPYYDKLSSRVTDDLYNLGLTARKQAVKAEDPSSKEDDKLKSYFDNI